jgi:hypothetical protein
LPKIKKILRSREVVINLPLFDDDDLLLFFAFSGSQIEPYGIDYILQRLGFNHARTTIPKWCQRGCMDPLDKILSVIVLKTIQVVKEERKKTDGSTSNNTAPPPPQQSTVAIEQNTINKRKFSIRE